ncbi:MAG: hypothetical protein CML20_00490 [Rheinheimera sp.]|uniref:DUF6671 family protein n=1 Tax=Arsukibacterium sp. UBA3155 TaxID=1946058 RepID=UPI000C917A12|nr:DUF6671 family protein [Arsukibacterium sp. UBA3155]MAD73281.1 hypothetical protein [Rheinheimera sp.]
MTSSVAMLTRHDKARLIAPALSQLGWQLTELDSFDTDTLGSFAGEYPRFMTAQECAFRKAALAAELSGRDIGLGSEGSFSVGPFGIGTYNLELICCVNVAEGWAVTGRFYGPSLARQWQLKDAAALEQALADVEPGQHLLLQQGHYLKKALTVAQAHNLALLRLANGDVTLSYDLRAHLSPQRRLHIQQAADDLARRLQSYCPECSTPGFWPDKALPGLPCEACGVATNLTRHRRACCQHCGHTTITPVAARHASQQYCQECNP